MTDSVQVASDSQDLERALLSLDQVAAETVLLRVAEDHGMADALDLAVAPALVGIGAAWERREVALSQVFLSGRLCERLVTDRLGAECHVRSNAPRMAVGVLDDAHVLGKQIVVQVLRSCGYEVSDWGSRLSVDDVVAGVQREQVEVLFISVLMLRAALQVAKLRRRLEQLGRRPAIVVGGAPFRLDPALGSEVGADYVGWSASDVLPILSRIEARR